MSEKTLEETIRKVAMDFDNAIEAKNNDLILKHFHEACKIEVLGITLSGKEGVRKWINWLFENIETIKFTPRTIMVNGNTFFEEFVVNATLKDGTAVESKQAEVLIYENHKIISLRLYFDRLDFSNAIAKGFLSKWIIRKLIRESVKALKE